MALTTLLDAYFIPLAKLDVKKAVIMLLSGRAIPADNVKLKFVAKLGLSQKRKFKFPSHLECLVDGDFFLIPHCIKLTHPVDKKFLRRKSVPTRNGILKRDKHSCQYCGSRYQLTIDHIIPKSRGGSDTWDNLITSCHPCNNKKSNKTPEEAGFTLKKPPSDYGPSDSYSDFWNDIHL